MRDDDFFEAVVAVGELMSWLSVLFCFCYQLFGIVDINNISFSFASIASLLIFIVFFIIPMTSIMAIVAIPASFIFAFVFMGALHIFCSIVRFSSASGRDFPLFVKPLSKFKSSLHLHIPSAGCFSLRQRVLQFLLRTHGGA